MVAERAQLRGTARTPHVVALSEALTRAGHEVTVLPRGDRDLAAAVRACRPDVVLAHCRSDHAAAVARAVDVPFVFSPHADLRDPAVPSRADHVLVTFTRQRQRLIAAGVPRQHTSVVPYGVDIDQFTPDGGHADRRRPQLVIALGAMAPPSGFGTAVAELRDYADSLGVADRVRLVGPVPGADVPTLLRSADLMVCSSWEGTFGMAAVEAMACGLAVVANRTGGLVDTVVDKVTGIHVAPRRPRELAA